MQKKPETFEEMFEEIFKEAHSLICSKQVDYGPHNISKFGEYGVLVRASDKIERLINLLNAKDAPAHESIEDSWRDLMNYSAIAIACHRKLWTKDHCPPLRAVLPKNRANTVNAPAADSDFD